MRRVLLILGGALALLLSAGFIYVDQAPSKRFPVPKLELRVEVTPERVARGKHWATLLCAGCHLDPATGALTGQAMPDLPKELGVAFSRNITGHPTKGIGAWTDGELVYALRTGVARDGRYLPPWMVKLPHMADEDLYSIIAFLRSDDPWVAPRDVDNRESSGSMLAKALLRAGVFGPLPMPAAPIVRTSTTDLVAFGKYLDETLDCYQCHSADFKTNNVLEPERSEGFLGGGNPLLDGAGRRIYSANLTPDPEHGIGKWSAEDFRRALKEGVRPSGVRLRYPMEIMHELRDVESDALYAYLRTVPKSANQVPPPESGEASASDEGQRIYRTYGCAACHGDDGAGRCDLTQGPAKYRTDEALIAFIKHPIGTVPDSKMPAWDGVIKDAEYKPLLQHLRALAAARGH